MLYDNEPDSVQVQPNNKILMGVVTTDDTAIVVNTTIDEIERMKDEGLDLVVPVYHFQRGEQN